MLEKGLRKIGKEKVFSIIMLVTVMLNIFFILLTSGNGLTGKLLKMKRILNKILCF